MRGRVFFFPPPFQSLPDRIDSPSQKALLSFQSLCYQGAKQERPTAVHSQQGRISSGPRPSVRRPEASAVVVVVGINVAADARGSGTEASGWRSYEAGIPLRVSRETGCFFRCYARLENSRREWESWLNAKRRVCVKPTSKKRFDFWEKRKNRPPLSPPPLFLSSSNTSNKKKKRKASLSR